MVRAEQFGRNVAFDLLTIPAISGGLDAGFSHGNPYLTFGGLLVGLGIVAIPSSFFRDGSQFKKETNEHEH